LTQLTDGQIMTEVVILVVSTLLLFIWLFSLRAKAIELRRQRLLVAAETDAQNSYSESDQRSA